MNTPPQRPRGQGVAVPQPMPAEIAEDLAAWLYHLAHCARTGIAPAAGVLSWVADTLTTHLPHLTQAARVARLNQTADAAAQPRACDPGVRHPFTAAVEADVTPEGDHQLDGGPGAR